MRRKITVVDAPDVSEQLREGDWVDVVGLDALPGSDIVVLGAGADSAALSQRIASRASGAAIVVLDPSELRTVLESSLFTRGRVFSVPAERVRSVAEAVLYDRCETVDVTMVGLDGEVATLPVILGAGGVREIVS